MIAEAVPMPQVRDSESTQKWTRSCAERQLPTEAVSNDFNAPSTSKCGATVPKKTVVKVRKENAQYERELNDQLTLVASLRKKLSKVEERESMLKKDKSALNRQVLYCVKFFRNLKKEISGIKSRKVKKTVLPLLTSKFEDVCRAPSATLSLQKDFRIDKLLKDSNQPKETESPKVQLQNKIERFYTTDENSAPLPNARAFVKKGKIRKRRRYLNDTIDNLYEKFRASFSHLKVSRALFFASRPFWVTKRKVTSRDTCLCKEHANFELIVNKLRLLKVIQAKNVHEFVNTLCCDVTNEDCMFRNCANCCDFGVLQSDSKSLTWYYTWATETENRTSNKGKPLTVKVTSKLKVHCTVSKMISTINSMIAKYLKHIFSKQHQFKMFDAIKNNLNENEAYIVIDFSQNWIAKYAEEIHSVHFGASQKQITLHTGGFWIKSDSGVLFESFASISNCTRHDAAAVWALLQPIFDRMFELSPDLQKIHFQSDGPTTQYKNKTNFFLFNHFSKKLKLKSSSWNFSTPGHGKSTADGIGGKVKAMCDTVVACGQDVLCAEDMVNVVKQKSSKIRAYLVSEKEVTIIDELTPKNLVTIPQTMQTHQIAWTDEHPDKLSFRYLSCTECISRNHCNHYELEKASKSYEIIETDSQQKVTEKEPENTFKVSQNDWVVVIYDEIWYLGQVKKISGNKLTVSFLTLQKKFYTWPAIPDEQTLFLSQILCNVDPPIQVVTKSKDGIRFRLTEEQLTFINDAAKKCKIY